MKKTVNPLENNVAEESVFTTALQRFRRFPPNVRWCSIWSHIDDCNMFTGNDQHEPAPPPPVRAAGCS